MEPALPIAATPLPPPSVSSSIQLPLYWSLLSDPDKMAYGSMRQALSSSACKHRRHHSTEINQDILNTLRGFVMRGDADDWKRALVCGVCWLNGAIAINTRQLRLLLSKCKSSVNAMFQNIGYATVPTTSDYGGALAAFFPVIKDNFTELRKWTIRSAKPVAILGNLPAPIADTGEAAKVEAAEDSGAK
jgi:hypothetical protein